MEDCRIDPRRTSRSINLNEIGMPAPSQSTRIGKNVRTEGGSVGKDPVSNPVGEGK
jgi:hypothetical protein